MKFFREFRTIIFLCLPVALIICAAWLSSRKQNCAEGSACQVVSISRNDPNWDVIAMSELSFLMDRRPQASKYSVRWDQGGKDLAGFYYSVEKQELLYENGHDWRTDESLSNDTSVQISQSEFKAAGLQRVPYYALDEWVEKRRLSRMSPAELKAWKAQRRKDQLKYRRLCQLAQKQNQYAQMEQKRIPAMSPAELKAFKLQRAQWQQALRRSAELNRVKQK